MFMTRNKGAVNLRIKTGKHYKYFQWTATTKFQKQNF